MNIEIIQTKKIKLFALKNARLDNFNLYINNFRKPIKSLLNNLLNDFEFTLVGFRDALIRRKNGRS